MKKFITLSLLSVSLIAVSAPAFAAKIYTLKLSTQLADTTPICQGYYEIAKRIDKNTKGGMKIEVYPSAQLGSDEDVIEQAVEGANVAVLTDAGRMGNFVHDMGVMGMAYFADSYDEALKATQTKTFAKWEEELSTKNAIRVLCFNFYDGARHFLTNKPINKPEDLKGMRIRTPGAPAWAESVKAMGATPIAMPWGDTYSGVQSKALDGCEVQHTSTLGSRMYEVVKYINKTGHFQLINGLICGEKWFKTLPADYQKILVDTCREVATENAHFVEKRVVEIEKELIKHGMIVNNPDVAAFKAAADEAYKKLGFVELRAAIYKEIGKK